MRRSARRTEQRTAGQIDHAREADSLCSACHRSGNDELPAAAAADAEIADRVVVEQLPLRVPADVHDVAERRNGGVLGAGVDAESIDGPKKVGLGAEDIEPIVAAIAEDLRTGPGVVHSDDVVRRVAQKNGAAGAIDSNRRTRPAGLAEADVVVALKAIDDIGIVAAVKAIVHGDARGAVHRDAGEQICIEVAVADGDDLGGGIRDGRDGDTGHVERSAAAVADIN